MPSRHASSFRGECQDCGNEFDRRYDPHYRATIKAAGTSNMVYLCEDCHQEGGILGIITLGEWKHIVEGKLQL